MRKEKQIIAEEKVSYKMELHQPCQTAAISFVVLVLHFTPDAGPS